MKEDRCFGTAQSFSLDRPDHRLAVLLSSEQKARGGQQHRNPNAFQYHLYRPRMVPNFVPGELQVGCSACGPGDSTPNKPIAGEATCCALIVSGHRDVLKLLSRTAYRSLGWMGTDRTPAVAEDSCDWAAPIWWRSEADRH